MVQVTFNLEFEQEGIVSYDTFTCYFNNAKEAHEHSFIIMQAAKRASAFIDYKDGKNIERLYKGY